MAHSFCCHRRTFLSNRITCPCERGGRVSSTLHPPTLIPITHPADSNKEPQIQEITSLFSCCSRSATQPVNSISPPQPPPTPLWCSLGPGGRWMLTPGYFTLPPCETLRTWRAACGEPGVRMGRWISCQRRQREHKPLRLYQRALLSSSFSFVTEPFFKCGGGGGHYGN